MKNWKAIVVAGAATAALSVPVFAVHEHHLVTPGTCVEDIASGQTAKAEGEGGGHKFHENVHKGQPGMVAFENPNNPVSIGAGACPSE